MTTERILTPSKISAWLDCDHYLSMTHKVDAGELKVESNFGEMARMLLDKGLEHERACLEFYESQGKAIYVVDDRPRSESFGDWVERIGNTPFATEPDVIFQMPFVHDGIRGIADFLIKVERSDGQGFTYEPLDAKLARAEAKPSHILQLCFYADAIKAATGDVGENIHVWLGSGEVETHRREDFVYYWRRLRGQLKELLSENDRPTETFPEPCSHCDFCEFNRVCEAQWREADSLVYVAGVPKKERKQLEANGIQNLAALAAHDPSEEIEGLRSERVERITKQAQLQKSRLNDEAPPPFELIEPGDDPTWGRGFEQLPEPNEGDIFLDYEGHPFWSAKTGLFFLLGLIARDDEEWQFVDFWAHDLDGEREATQKLIDYIVERRAQYPDMHVYHYNHTERSALERLVDDHELNGLPLAELISEGVFVDLFTIARNAVQVGTESYGLKHLERLAAFERSHDIEAGAGAVVEYENFMADEDLQRLERIAKYNEDDVRATMALRDWMLENRPAETPWRDSILLKPEKDEERSELVEAMLGFAPGTPEHLVGQLLGYWDREWKAAFGPTLMMLADDPDSAFEMGNTIGGLVFQGFEPRISSTTGNKLKGEAAVFSFPEQELDSDFKDGAETIFANPEGPFGFAKIDSFDVESGTLKINWNEALQERGVFPTAVAFYKWFEAGAKREAIEKLARQMLDPATHGEVNPVSLALLRAESPRFTSGQAPDGGTFNGEIDSIVEWVEHLDGSYVPVQGPPGTGKTYSGARIVKKLILGGQRVGISAMSHTAIDNLFNEVLDLAQQEGWHSKLKAVRIGKESVYPWVKSRGKASDAVAPDVNLCAGTAWFFANQQLEDSPFDVVIIDEAGQLSLADAIATSSFARNILLLGDPLQLPQVAQATHPGRSGLSVLEHVLGDDETIPADRGVFLETTHRMHPDVCGFISDLIYEGRLNSHELCAQQGTELGTGLRWIEAQHTGCATESEIEADLVVEQVTALLGKTRWFEDAEGARTEAPIRAVDIMVVAPYNDQVNLILDKLDRSFASGVRVGTVDKFQGQEAPVVIFSMTSSNTDDIKRGQSFLFSRERLNVAISRAKCLAYLVCTKDILDARATDVEGMRRLSTLAAFVEFAD